jgi:hypothetical protein
MSMPHYIYYSLIYANLFRVGVDPDDEEFEEESSFQRVCISVGFFLQ